MPAPHRTDPLLPIVFTVEHALAVGLTRDQIRQRARAGEWERLARGIFSRITSSSTQDKRLLHALRAVAATLNHPGALIAFSSAALVHRLPLHLQIPKDVTLCVPPGRWSGRRSGVHLRQVELPVEMWESRVASPYGPGPLPLIGPACAWNQVTSDGALVDGLVIGDAGLRRGLFSRDELRAMFELLAPRRGRRTIEQALAHLDGRRESPLESQSWAYFIATEVPLPEPQVEIRDEWGDFVARVDVAWLDKRVIGEVDGRSKYAKPEDLYREKRREDRLRALGFQVVRWGAMDLRSKALALHLKRTLGTPKRSAA